MCHETICYNRMYPSTVPVTSFRGYYIYYNLPAGLESLCAVRIT